VSFIAAATPAADPEELPGFDRDIQQELKIRSRGRRGGIAVSLSSPTTTVHGLADAYAEAERARCAKFFNGTGVHRSGNAGCAMDERRLEEQTHELQRALLAGNSDEVRELIASLLDEERIRDQGGSACLSRVLHEIRAHVAAFCAYAGEIEDCELPDLLGFFSLADVRRTLEHELVRLAERRPEPAAEHWIVGEARRYIYEKLAQQVDMRELAARLGLSYAYFSALFKEKAGRPFSEELTRIRMDEAHRLLRHSHLGVEETADRVGYQSPKHFSRIFKSHFGVPPSRVREHGGAYSDTNSA
jgi:AraC-like DNA-binding protein